MAVQGLLSGCRISRDLERFARRHREALNQALGLRYRRWPSDASYLYLLNKAHLQGFGQVLQAWMISQIPGGAEGLDQLVCDGKTLRGAAVETENGTHRFVAQGADVLLTVKGSQKTLHRQICSQFQGKRQIPFTAEDHEKRHGRDTTWNLRAKEAPDHIKANWPGCSCVVEVITTVTRKGKRVEQAHYFLTSLHTAVKALLRLVRQRWSIEDEWHWVRDVQLGENAHRDANRIGAPLFSFLRTAVMNLLRRAGMRSIHAGQQELAHDISRMLALAGVITAISTA